MLLGGQKREQQHTGLVLLTYSMQHSPSWEANRFSASQEIPRILWDLKVRYRIHKCPPPVPILSQSTPPHPTSWRPILILSSHLRLGLPSDLFPSGFPTKTLYTPLLSLTCATCPAHLIHLDFITRTILGEQYKSLSSSWCSFLKFPVTSSLLGPIFSSAPYPTPSAYVPPSMWTTKFRTHTKRNRQNYSSVYLNLYSFG